MKEFMARALEEFRSDPLRTLLSLLGVSVGVFSIVAVLVLVDSLEAALKEGFEEFGTGSLFIEQVPLEPDLNEDGVFRWWEYASRPQVSFREYRFLEERLGGGAGGGACAIAFCSRGEGVTGVDGDWTLAANCAVAAGRGFSDSELRHGGAVALVGADRCRALLKEKGAAGAGGEWNAAGDSSAGEGKSAGAAGAGGEGKAAGAASAVGMKIRAGGALYTVIGVFERSGTASVNTIDVDNVCLVPFRSMSAAAGAGGTSNSIIVSGVPAEEVRMLMRQARRLAPGMKDNFAVNRLSFIINEMNEIFLLLERLGWIVGFFSLLVGGFGIANIMYVSVEERKREIGIRRAIGAKRRTIVGQIVGESAALSLLGGAAGICLAVLCIAAVNLWTGAWGGAWHPDVSAAAGRASGAGAAALALRLGFGRIAAGLAVASLLGIASGTFPARHAASIDPAEAIRG